MSRLQGVVAAFAECGIQFDEGSRQMNTRSWSVEYVTARLPKLLGALEALPFDVNVRDLVRRQPTLLATNDVGDAVRRHGAAFLRLHPGLDFGKVITRAPALLTNDRAHSGCQLGGVASSGWPGGR